MSDYGALNSMVDLITLMLAAVAALLGWKAHEHNISERKAVPRQLYYEARLEGARELVQAALDASRSTSMQLGTLRMSGGASVDRAAIVGELMRCYNRLLDARTAYSLYASRESDEMVAQFIKALMATWFEFFRFFEFGLLVNEVDMSKDPFESHFAGLVAALRSDVGSEHLDLDFRSVVGASMPISDFLRQAQADR